MRPNSGDIAGVAWCEIDTSSIGHVETFIWTEIASPDCTVVDGTRQHEFSVCVSKDCVHLRDKWSSKCRRDEM